MTIELVTFRSRKPIIAKKKVTFRFLSSPILTQIEMIIFQSKIVVDRSYFLLFSFAIFFNSCSENAFPCFCSFCRVAWNWPLITEIELFEFTGSPFNDTAQYISYKHDMHEPIRYVLDHLDKWHLIWYGSKVPRERIMWIEIYAHCCFCDDSAPFLIFSLIADGIYEFFLGWWILFFFIRQ